MPENLRTAASSLRLWFALWLLLRLASFFQAAWFSSLGEAELFFVGADGEWRDLRKVKKKKLGGWEKRMVGGD